MRSSHFGLVQETRCYKSKLNIDVQDITQIPGFRVPIVTSQAAELSTWISAAPPSAMAEVAAIPLCVFAKPPVLTPQVTIGPMAKWQDHWSLRPGRVATPDFSGRSCHSFHDLVSKSLLISMRQRRGWQPALAMKQLAGLRMLADMVPFVAKHGRRSTRSNPRNAHHLPSVVGVARLATVSNSEAWNGTEWPGVEQDLETMWPTAASRRKPLFWNWPSHCLINCHEQLWFLRPLLATSSQWQLESTGPTQC